MDITQFTEFKAGQLEPIETDAGPNWAFVPNPLPRGFELSAELWPLAAQARDSVGRLEQIKGILADPFLLLRPLQQREALRSSSLEGTYTLPEELLLFDAEQEEGEAVVTPSTGQRNEQREVWNHYEALRQGHNWIKAGKRLDKSLILHLHNILMTGVRGKDKDPGRFRKRLVAVGAPPRRFIPPPPERVDACIDDLVRYMETAEGCVEPLTRCFLVHYQFEAIHPFEDGNGRVGRVLLSLCMSKWLGLMLPWLYLSEFYERNRRDYNQRLFMISANGEWDEWIEFCMHGTIEQSISTISRCEFLRNLRDEFITKYSGLGNRMREIIDMIFIRPVVRISPVAKKCGVSHESARQDLQKLVRAGVLKEIEKTKPKAFACVDVIDAAYGDASTRLPVSSSSRVFRRRRDSDTWHFFRSCTFWPTQDYVERAEKPTSGELCNECTSKDRTGDQRE